MADRGGRAAALLPLIFAGVVLAQPLPRDLPGDSEARAWVEADPSVQQARWAWQAATHAGAAIAAGPQEWSVRLQAQRRELRDAGATSHEWLAQLERPVRINGKAALDRTLGELEGELARARLGEARHEAARDLAELWLDVQAAQLQDRLWAEQREVAGANLAAVERRLRAGDASRLDADLARADLAEVERQASAAAAQLAGAGAALRVRFPQAQPPTGALSEPQPLQWDEARWRQRIVEESDPLKLALLQARRARIAAERASADRVADPTVGVYTASEARRNERITGLALTVPLGGEYRRERALQLLRDADAAEAAAAVQRQRIELEVARGYAQASGALQRWNAAERSAAAALAAARLTQRAYSLGEAELQSLLLARRQAMEARRSALEARTEALRGAHRLLVDAHLVWGLQDD